MKKFVLVLLSISLTIILTACGGGYDQESTFLSKINESYVNMLRIDATFRTYKVQQLDTAKISTFHEYLDKIDKVFNEAKTASSEYLTVVENNHSTVVSLYNDLLNSSNTSESCKAVAKEIYEDYEYMYKCVTDDPTSYLDWYEKFPDIAKSFDDNMQTYKGLLQ